MALRFFGRVAIDQHINTRNRWDDIIPVIKKYPDLLGIGLSEGTAIVVTGDRFEVIGKWKVAIHDNTRAYEPWEKPYYVLSPGDVYNMKTRKVEKYGTGVLTPAKIQTPGAAARSRRSLRSRLSPVAGRSRPTNRRRLRHAGLRLAGWPGCHIGRAWTTR